MELALIGAAATVAGALLGVIFQGFLERRERERQARIVAGALLYEIDHFYRFYVSDAIHILTEKRSPQFVMLQQNGDPFPVYHGNCSRLGELHWKITEAVVHLYAVARSHLTFLRTLSEVTDPLGHKGIVESVKRCKAVESLVFLACGLLSLYAEVPFEFPIVAVASAEVDTETQSLLKVGVVQLKKELSWSEKLRRFLKNPFHKTRTKGAGSHGR